MFDKAKLIARAKTATVETPGGVIIIRRPTITEWRGYLSALPKDKAQQRAADIAELLLVSIVCEDESGNRIFKDAEEAEQLLAPGEVTTIASEAHRLIFGDPENPPKTP